MANIRDLQKLRGTKNISVFAQTNYVQQLNPQTRKSYYEPFNERTPVTSRSPIKYRDTEDTSKSPSRLQIHRRGGSYALNTPQPNSPLIFQNPRMSLYSFSMKPLEYKKKEPTPSDLPLSDLMDKRQKDNFFQMNETPFVRKKSVLSSSPSKTIEVSKKMFNILYPIGKGGFGKVWKVQTKKGKQIYAMKMMSKVKIINKKSVQSVMNQKEFLSRLNHPFLVNMSSAFQDRDCLYLIMDYLDGGDLRYHLGNKRYFNQKQTKFFIANILIGLQYLSKNKIIHRDIKPQNLVLDSQGYVRITDLGISRQLRVNNAQDTSGTPGYMAPEVMCRKEHSFTVDYFALGVITYEFMLGKRPYQGKDRRQIKQNMLAKQAQVRIDQLPYKWSPHAIDFTNKLLQRNPQHRLGANGIHEIMQHQWLEDVEWEKIHTKKLKPPFKPISIEQDYESYKEQISQDTVIDNEQQTLLMLRDSETQSLFEGYYFQKRETELPNSRKISSTTTNCTEQNMRRR